MEQLKQYVGIDLHRQRSVIVWRDAAGETAATTRIENGVVALAAAFSYTLLVRTLIRANGKDSLVATAIASDVKGYASLGMYAAGVGLAFVSPWIASGIYFLTALMWLVPDRRIERVIVAHEKTDVHDTGAEQSSSFDSKSS